MKGEYMEDKKDKKFVSFADFVNTFRRGKKRHTDIERRTDDAAAAYRKRRKKKSKIAKVSRRRNRK
jgi:hypothetical protein